VSAAAAGAAMAAIAQAIRASGVLVRVSEEDFQKVLRKTEQPLVIFSKGGVFSTKYQYLTSYKGFAFYTKSSTELSLSPGIEIIFTKKIWVP
jgi:hypothetical protein